jgi:ArgP family transcriptional regulator
MPLNADQLEAFWMVVEAGGYHAAAERLFITQSAVTQRVQALEARLGQRLFVRAGRGVALTPAGELLARHCRARFEAEAGLLAQLGGEGGALAGRLAVAAGTSEGRLWLLPAVAALARAHPALDVTVTLDDQLDGAALLEASRVDAVLGETPLRRRGLRSTAVGQVPYRLAAAFEDWPDAPDVAQLVARRAIDFDPSDRITLDHLARCVPGADLGELRRHFVNDTHGILALALAGGGFAVLPEVVLAPHLASGALRAHFPEVISQRGLYWTTPEGPATPAVRALRQMIKVSN